MWSTDWKASIEVGEKWEVKINPEKIWTKRKSPNNLPKFHKLEILIGEGRSTTKPLIIFISGWNFRIFIYFSIKKKLYYFIFEIFNSLFI